MKAAANQYGVGIVLVIAVIAGLLYMLHKSYMARLGDKDKEIDRLAASNKEMLETILKRPLSSKRGKQ